MTSLVETEDLMTSTIDLIEEIMIAVVITEEIAILTEIIIATTAIVVDVASSLAYAEIATTGLDNVLATELGLVHATAHALAMTGMSAQSLSEAQSLAIDKLFKNKLAFFSFEKRIFML